MTLKIPAIRCNWKMTDLDKTYKFISPISGWNLLLFLSLTDQSHGFSAVRIKFIPTLTTEKCLMT